MADTKTKIQAGPVKSINVDQSSCVTQEINMALDKAAREFSEQFKGSPDWVDGKIKGFHAGFNYASHRNKELLERIKELEEGLSDSLQIMEQTLAHRDHVGLDGGNIFIEYAINNAKQLLNNKTDKG